MVKVPISLPAFNSFLGAQWPTYLWAPDSVVVITELRRGELMELPKIETCHGKLRLKLAGCLAVCAAAANLLFLISCPSAFAGRQHAFAIKVVTSQDDQFWTNSVIIEGTHEVMLVDAQFTKTNAERVSQEIKETKKPLSIIYITHEHADHFLGLQVFKEAYPGVRIIASPAVVDRINKVYQEKIGKWKKILGSGATSHVVDDTDENTMLWIPGQRILIAGDVVVNNMH
jgi:hypothetical protein